MRLYSGFIKVYCDEKHCEYYDKENKMCEIVYQFFPNFKCPLDKN